MKKKTYSMEIEFDSKDAAHAFMAHWLDGGGDGGGNIDWNTTKWKNYSYMRVEGTGNHIAWIGDKMYINGEEVKD